MKIDATYCAIAFSQMSWVQAPCGGKLIAGSEPPATWGEESVQWLLQ